VVDMEMRAEHVVDLFVADAQSKCRLKAASS
jgi:hypothetical protein